RCSRCAPGCPHSAALVRAQAEAAPRARGHRGPGRRKPKGMRLVVVTAEIASQGEVSGNASRVYQASQRAYPAPVFLLFAETPYCVRKRLLPGARMRWLRNTFLKGLAALLPVALTIFVVYWLATTAESAASGPLRALLPADRYWPGLGLLVACVLILIVGVLVDAYVVR